MGMNTISPAWLGFLRAIGVAIVYAVLSYIGDASHLTPVVSDSVAGIIAALALALEHSIEGSTGKALFGSVRSR